jgi:hypothetical protein
MINQILLSKNKCLNFPNCANLPEHFAPYYKLIQTEAQMVTKFAIVMTLQRSAVNFINIGPSALRAAVEFGP